MNKILNPAAWGRALRRPLVLTGLAVDLFPIYGVIAFGWNAVPLVMLYWMENIIAGLMTLPRIFLAGASFGFRGVIAGLFFCGFFFIHYGLFCAVHGSFLIAFIGFGEGALDEVLPAVMDVPAMFAFGLRAGAHIDWFVFSIFAFQLMVFVFIFVLRREWKNTTPAAEMRAPYGRIVVLHFGIFAGAAALFILGQPLIGVLALIVFRSLFGIITNGSYEFGFDNQLSLRLEGAKGREIFEQALQGRGGADRDESGSPRP